MKIPECSFIHSKNVLYIIYRGKYRRGESLLKKEKKEGGKGGRGEKEKKGRKENRLEGRRERRRKFGITGIKVYGHLWKLNELHIRPHGCQPDHQYSACDRSRNLSKRKVTKREFFVVGFIYLLHSILLHMEKLKL